jgi:cell division protein FtsZ
MKGKGMALMGTGRASGDDRARAAARQAISSPLLEDARVEGATGLLVAIAGADLSLADINDAMTLIQESAAAETNTIFGAIIDETLGDDIKVTVVATGFDRMQQIRSLEMVQQLTPRERQLNVPPPPPPTASSLRVTAPLELSGVQDVRVYATAGRGDVMQAAQPAPTAAPVPMPSARRAGNEGLPIDLDEPAYTRRTPSYGTSHASVQQSLNQGSLTKREPLVGNPFASDDGTEIDRPAFMRK